MISDASTYEDNQGIELGDDPPDPESSLQMGITDEARQRLYRDYKQAQLHYEQARQDDGQALQDYERAQQDYERSRQERVQKRKQKRVRDLLTSLNRLSAALFAAISVTERQISVLQDIHSVFLTSYRTNAKDEEKGYPFRRSPLHHNIVSIPILSENPEQIWPNTLDTIDHVVLERKSFIQKVKELVENMDIRRKIV